MWNRSLVNPCGMVAREARSLSHLQLRDASSRFTGERAPVRHERVAVAPSLTASRIASMSLISSDAGSSAPHTSR